MGLKWHFGSSTSPLLHHGQGQQQKNPIFVFTSEAGSVVGIFGLFSNVRKTPAQSSRDDQNYGDHTKISEFLSSCRMRPHFSDHLEFTFDMISKLLYSCRCV